MVKNIKLLNMTGYLLVIIVFLLSFLYYQSVFGPRFFSTNQLLHSPKELHGIEKRFMGQYAGSFEGGFFIIYRQEKIPVIYHEEYQPPRYGEVVVSGTIHKNGYLKAINVHNYDYNYLIYLISFLAGLFVIFAFFAQWKVVPPWRNQGKLFVSRRGDKNA